MSLRMRFSRRSKVRKLTNYVVPIYFIKLALWTKLGSIAESPIPLNIMLAINYLVFVKGDNTNFEIEPSFGVEASELYPDVKYTPVDELLNRFI